MMERARTSAGTLRENFDLTAEGRAVVVLHLEV
jgi:hypothetical protein